MVEVEEIYGAFRFGAGCLVWGGIVECVGNENEMLKRRNGSETVYEKFYRTVDMWMFRVRWITKWEEIDKPKSTHIKLDYT